MELIIIHVVFQRDIALNKTSTFFCFEFELVRAQVHSIPTKSAERLGCDVFGTLATHAGLVQDVSGAHFRATKWQHSRACFRDFQT